MTLFWHNDIRYVATKLKEAADTIMGKQKGETEGWEM